MALVFPTSPVPNQVYQRWQWNGFQWMPIQSVSEPMLPIAGGNVTGNLGVAGTTSLTGTLTAAGQTNLNTVQVNSTLDVLGQATFDDGVEIDGIDAADFATKTYVDDAVASGGLWQGTWDASANNPDLTQTTLQRNGWGWTVVTPDPTAPFDVPATPVIPGLNGLTVYNGDHVIWSDAASTFELVSGSSISRQEAEDLFPLKQDALIRGTPGTYTQGTDFTDFQTFLDENINNRWFDGPLVINLNVANTTTVITLNNVLFTYRARFDIIASAQVATTLRITSVFGSNNFVLTPQGGITFCDVLVPTDVNSLRIGGVGSYPSINALRCYIILGNTGADVSIGSFVISFDCTIFTGSANSPITIGSLANDGTFIVRNDNTGLVFPATITGAGQIIDNRPNHPSDTFTRAGAFLPLAGGNMAGPITMPANPSGQYDVATKGYVDAAAMAPVVGTFPHVISLPGLTNFGPPYGFGYALTIPGWTLASREIFIVRSSQMYQAYMAFNINGTGPRWINFLNPWSNQVFGNSQPIQQLGLPQQQQSGYWAHTGSGTYNFWTGGRNIRDWANAMVNLNIAAFQFNGSSFMEVSLSPSADQMAARLGAGRDTRSFWSGLQRSGGGGQSTEIPINVRHDFNVLSLWGTAGTATIWFRTADCSVISIHDRRWRGITRRLIIQNSTAGTTYTLRLVPHTDTWTTVIDPTGTWNYSSSYVLQVPGKLYGSGVITSPQGAGYIEFPVPAQRTFELKYKVMEQPYPSPVGALVPYRGNPTVFTGNFPNARSVVYIEDILTYQPA